VQSSEAKHSLRSPLFTLKVNLLGYQRFFWTSVQIGIVGVVAQRVVGLLPPEFGAVKIVCSLVKTVTLGAASEFCSPGVCTADQEY
jgi:hypothetical protein